MKSAPIASHQNFSLAPFAVSARMSLKRLMIKSSRSKLLTTTLVGTVAFGFFLSSGTAASIEMPTYSDANSNVINRGAYIARQADCMGCHQENYSGGVAIDSPMGEIFAPNITPSVRYGIGEYTEQDLKNVLTEGRAPTHMLYPAMPYPAYSAMRDEDIHALFAYFQTVTPIDEAPDHTTNLAFPFNIRPLMLGWNLINMPNWQPQQGLSDTELQGKYIVDNLAHCGTCHTPRNATLGYDMSNYLSGAMLGQWHAPNITPDDSSGIGSWSNEDIVNYLRSGELHKKALAAGPMSEVVMNSTRYLKDDDLNAMASYLKAVPAIKTKDTVEPINTAALPKKHSDDISIDLIAQIDYLKTAKAQAQSPSETLYLAHCASCHGVNGYGQPDAGYASIVGLSTLRRHNPAPVLNIIANGIHDVVNTRPQMPGFAEDLSPDDIAQITNYVRVKFGGMPESQVTQDEVKTFLKQGSSAPFLIRNASWLAALGIIVGLILLVLLIRWFLRRKLRIT